MRIPFVGLFLTVAVTLTVSQTVSNNYIFTATELRDLQNVPTLANGNLAFIAYSDTIHLSGLYNGAAAASQRARIPNYGRVQFEFCGVTTEQTIQNCTYSLNVQQGVFQTYSTLRNNGFSINLITYPHRYFERTIVNQLTVYRIAADRDAQLVRLFASPGSNSVDLELIRQQSGAVQGTTYTIYEMLQSTSEKGDVKQTVFVFAEDVPEAVTLAEGEATLSVSFITTIGVDIVTVLDEFTAAVQRRSELLQLHVAEWQNFWTDSGISVEGNDNVAKAIHSSLYTLAAALPSTTFYSRDANREFGLSASGLGNENDRGHTTWDEEIWLQPSALLLEPQWSANILHYRFAKSAAAALKASSAGFRGVSYPVRSGESGDDLETDAELRALKNHVTGDVAFAVKQHFFATLDEEWFQNEGCQITLQTAAFWASRLKLNLQTRRLDLENVSGPNAGRGSQINNAYTNVLAAINLYFAEFAACHCSATAYTPKPDLYLNQARSIQLPHLSASDVTPLFQDFSFDFTNTISEAEIILLNYPLHFPLNSSTHRNNLRSYEVTQAGAPSTTYAVQNIVRLGLAETPTLAQFEQSFVPFVRSEFQLWSEFNGNTLVNRNHVAGAGGFLQQIINGFAGIRLLDDGLVISNVQLPPGTTRLMLNGFKYLKGSYLVEITQTEILLRIKTNDANTEFLVNGLVQEPTNAQFRLPREATSITLRPRINSYGSCRHIVEAIGQEYPIPNNYILNATTVINDQSSPTLSNGDLSFVAYSDTVHLNGVFNGVGAESHRSRIPNYGRIQFEYCGPFELGAENCSFHFDLRRGLFQTISNYNDNKFTVELLTFPHRLFDRTIVNQLRVVRNTDDQSAFLVRLFASPGSNSADLNLTKQQLYNEEGVDFMEYELTPISLENADVPAKTVSVFSEIVPEAVSLPAGQNEITFTWTTSIGIDLGETLTEFTEVVSFRSEQLLPWHVNEWERFWTESGVTVEGDPELAQTIHASLYAVASALPSLRSENRHFPENYGSSPAGLTNDHYRGHSLWDTEIWVQPIALLLEPQWSERLLGYRYTRRSAAARNAVKLGFAGLLYPVESAESGDEVSTDSSVANFRHHVSGDVAVAVKQHLFATSDTNWFRQVGCDLAYQTGQFWMSRANYNNVTERFDIADIIGPDVSQQRHSNNAYTNVLAATNLFFAEFAACVCKPDNHQTDAYYKLARSIALPHVNESDFTPAYDGYQAATSTQEAETILLRYPLNYPLNESTHRNNLRAYAANLERSNVPSTTYAVQNIVRLSLAEIPTAEQFTRSYEPYVRGDFKQWSHFVGAEIVVRNHVSGAAGFLQQILNGYAGIKVTDDGLVVEKAVLPPGASVLTLNGIKYQQGTYKLEVTADQIALTVVNADTNTEILINDVSQSLTNGYFMYPRTSTTIRLRSRLTPFGECQYVTSTIGHASGAQSLVASVAALLLMTTVTLIASVTWL